jgi:hypothetical protein
MTVKTKKVTQTDLDFTVFSRAVAAQFQRMSAHPLFRASTSKDDMWAIYQAAWPEGTNEIFRERREHDCQKCKHFIRAVGGVVAVIDGELVSIWDAEMPEPYATVAAAMSRYVESCAIDNVFLTSERTAGVAKNFQQVITALEFQDSFAKASATPLKSERVIEWNHFSVAIPDRFVVSKKDIGPKLADARATHDVLLRGLQELTLDSVDTVLELIAQNSLYRGEEYKHSLQTFRALKVKFDAVSPAMQLSLNNRAAADEVLNERRDQFAWLHAQAAHPTASRIRNTAIGTLLIDLSAGIELEDAVKKFETSVMAPSNYKRPTALVSKAMIEKARVKIDELGLASALERRYAVIDDITVNNILFADRSAKVLRGQRGGGKTAESAFAELAEKIPEDVKKLDRVEEIGIEKFLKDVLPKATSLEVLFENKHAGNLVSLIAPVDPTAKNLFKWPNKFSWSYAGDVADSIKERVKRAGGSVVGDLCCRLAWDYTDDLDFHMIEPAGAGRGRGGFGTGSTHIFYGNVRRPSASGGILDLDANGCDGLKAEPAENIFYADKANMAEGVYELTVNNYSRRSTGSGFEAQVEFGGVTHNFVYEKALRTGETVSVAKVKYSHAAGFEIIESLPSTQTSKEVWGMQTQTFRKANVVMLSPNWWDGYAPGTATFESLGDVEADERVAKAFGIGNKHYFFMLEGCANEGKARGYYNEFLRADLEPHRKVMEMVGAKMRTDEAAHQLSGLGFSSTQRAELTVRVGGTFSRVVKVVF